MISNLVRRLVVVCAVLVFPALTYAQEVIVSGTVTDATGAVLPGVAVRAVHEATGNTFEGFTDERGIYRIAARVGVYRVTAELSGFATASRAGLEVLVGQQLAVNLQMAPSGLAETITVTGEAPLINVISSSLGGNLDSRQLQELPVLGRNFIDLTLLAPGSRANAIVETPGLGYGEFQYNVDGQQVTGNCCSAGGQPRYSRDAVAEFEFISNRFDATQGRSSGVQVNVVTKSGTNTPSGLASAYFRDDRFNAADFIQNRVLPYSNQQVSSTFGGPLLVDRMHFFGNYEYEREPLTVSHSSPWPSFNFDLMDTRREQKAGLRFDFQASPATRLMVRGNSFTYDLPYDSNFGLAGATVHPSGAVATERHTRQLNLTMTRVLRRGQALNEVKAGWAGHNWGSSPRLRYSGANHPGGVGSVSIVLRGYQIGPASRTPQRIGQEVYSVRDDFSFTFGAAGRHDVKSGGEYLNYHVWHDWCTNLNGTIEANLGSVPANIEALFPVWDDPSTWNLAALSSITRRYTYTVGSCSAKHPRNIFAGWVQDDWRVNNRLTLNLGLRYDFETGLWANELAAPPFLEGDRPNDANNVAPRVGFVFRASERTAIRGGAGKFYAEVINQLAHGMRLSLLQKRAEVLNDGRPDFAANPFGGRPQPTFEDILRTGCDVSPVAGCVRSGLTLANPDAAVPHSYQTSIGVQHQFRGDMAVNADYVFTGIRNFYYTRDINISYDPATGANYPFTNLTRRPYPDWAGLSQYFHNAWSNYHGLETSLTKRLSNRWQANGTYSWSAFRDGNLPPVTEFAIQPDLYNPYGLTATDQRHRATFNGIWQVGYGFQLSGLYFFGSGVRYATNYGGDLRNSNGNGDGRLRPDGTIVPRANLVGRPIHRVDMRIQRRFPLVGRTGVDALLEVFNLFNHENYGSYTTAESNAKYGQPSFNSNVAYQPRMLQMGFRFTF